MIVLLQKMHWVASDVAFHCCFLHVRDFSVGLIHHEARSWLLEV
jgi:hypothetical protein